MTEPRALVFDLDDTLYPYRAFVESGFHAVAAHVARAHGVSAATALRTLRRARVTGHRGYELQQLCAVLQLPTSWAETFRDCLRGHTPTLRLPRSSARVLSQVRADWRLGVLTNGDPAIQARKIAALGVASLVDVVVYAADYGDRQGKPAPEGFEGVLARLGVRAGSAVFVGNDPVVDMAGAARVGMRTIHLRREPAEGRGAVAACADASVTRLGRVPDTAAWLVGG